MSVLLEKIVAAKLVTKEQAKAAELWASAINRSVWCALVKLEYVSEEQLVRFFAQEAQIPYVNLPDYRIKRGAVEMLEEHFCKQNTVIPLCRVGDTLFLACSNPFNAALMDTIGKLTRCIVEPLVATSTGIIQALDYYWHEPLVDYSMADFLVRQEPVKGMAFWREAERIAVDWPVELFPTGEALSLAVPSSGQGRASDISRDGSAIGVRLSVYMPRGVTVAVLFVPSAADVIRGRRLEAQGEIVHSFMQSTHAFCVGIRFVAIEPDVRRELLMRAGGAGGTGA
ncbi:MAG TPA: hypothetical protein PKL03_05525 [Candidatus Omnitrophota bacterium]|nr:hypothetical protein [Candidatus Omnitrophota bacterium]